MSAESTTASEKPDSFDMEEPDPNREAELDPHDEEMAFMLAEGFTHAATAKVFGISSKTIQRRLKNRAFKEHMLERRRERLSATTGRLIQLSDSAVDTLREVLASEDERLHLRAAQVLLDLGRRHHREDAIEWDLGTRVEAIERILEQEAGER